MTSDTTKTSASPDLTAELEERLQFETLLAELSAKLINLPAREIDRQIEDAQRLVCDALGLDLSSLWQWRPDKPWMLTLTHYYRPLGGPPAPQTMDAQEFFPWCQRQILAGKVVKVASLTDLPAEAARDREVWNHFGVKTTLTIPLSAGGGPVFGCVSFNDMKAERRWSEALVQRLQLVAQIFANALARKVTDQALSESEARLSLAADAASLGLWSLNLATNRFWVTDKTRELFGFLPDEEITFERFLGLVHPNDQEMVRQTVRTMVHARSDGRVEYRTVRPDGSVRWMLSRGRVRCSASGEPSHLMGVTVDITASKQSEQEIAQQRYQLTHLSRVNMLGELAGSLAHELNQPLTAILSNAQAAQRFLAHDQPDLNEVRDILTDIVAEDKRAGEVIRRLRLLLKKGEVQHHPLNINEAVQEVLKLVRSDLVNQNFTAQTELASNLPVLHGDRVQIQQVLLNLVMNGCDAMNGAARDQRQLTLRTRLAEDGSVYISVTDCGAGIDPEKLEQVFEPFYTTKPHGLGLGLAVCRTIVTAHGGKLWATNNPGRGATFHVALPAGGKGQGAGGE